MFYGEGRLVKLFIFLCFFLGNDFLPHFPAVNIRKNGVVDQLKHQNIKGENGME